MRILIAIMFCLPVLSSTIQKFNGPSEQNIILTYEENDSFIIDHIQVPIGKLQNLILRKTFIKQKDRDSFKKSYLLSNRFINLKSKKIENTVTENKNYFLWQPTNEWSLQWEESFSKWIEKEFNQDFFVKYNLATDCADVAFALRWIYARINSLPVANTLAGSGTIFTHESMKQEWLSLKRANNWYEDELFLASLDYLMKHVYTGTLNIDGYPISLSKETFLVGTIHLDGGHTMIISKIDYNQKEAAPIWKLSSTVPAQVRQLFEDVMVDSSMTNQEYGGLFRMRWPVQINGKWSLVKKDKMPLYSLEQYEEDFLDGEKNFTIALIKRLGIAFNPQKLILKTISSIKEMLNQRVSVVEQGHTFCLTHDCTEGTFNYEEHSTPTRDKRIKTAFKTGRDLAQNLSSFDPQLPRLFENSLANENIEILGSIKSLSKYEQLFNNYVLSNHPDDSLEERWAADAESMLSTLEKKFQAFLLKRNNLITPSSICDSTNCNEGTQNFEMFNTYKFDSSNRLELLLGSNFIQENFNLFLENKDLKTKMSKLPYFLSTPYSINRFGEQITDNKRDKVVKANKIIELDKNHILLDRSILNMSLNKRVSLPSDSSIIQVNKVLGLILVQTSKSILIINKDGKVNDQLTKKFDRVDISAIGSTHIAITERSSTTYTSEISIYDISNQSFDFIDNLGQSNGYHNDFDMDEYSLIKNNNAIFSNQSGTVLNVYYTQDDLLKIYQISATQHLNLRRFGDKLFYTDEKGKLNILNLVNLKSCQSNIQDISYISDIINKYISISSEQGGRQTLYKFDECQLEELYTSTNHYGITAVKENILIEEYSNTSSTHFYYDGIKTVKLNPSSDVIFYSFNGGVSSWVKSNEQGIQEYFEIDLVSGSRTDLNKNELILSCKLKVSSSPSCKTASDTNEIFFYTGKEAFKYYKTGNEIISNYYTDYSDNESRLYIEKRFDLDSWDYFQIESGLVILRERI